MRKLTAVAVTATLALGFGSSAFAGEGSPDLALPYWSRGADANVGYSRGDAWTGTYRQDVAPHARTFRSDGNIGAVRRHLHEDQNGIDGE